MEKTQMLGKIEGKRRSGWQRMRWLDAITDSMAMNEQTLGDSEGQGMLAYCRSSDCKGSDMDWWLNNNVVTRLIMVIILKCIETWNHYVL